MGKPELIVERVPIASLERDPDNARKHSQRNIDAIAGSLRTFGQRRPLVVWGDIIIAGNGTVEAAESLGWDEIEVTRVPVDWSRDQAKAFALADNRTAELAEWDSDVLAGQLIELEETGYEIDDWGFDPIKEPEDDAWAGIGDLVKDREPFQQMAFTVSDEQAEIIKNALHRAKELGPFINTGNENANANALTRVAEIFLGMNS